MKQCSECCRTYDDTWNVCLYCSTQLIPNFEKKPELQNLQLDNVEKNFSEENKENHYPPQKLKPAQKALKAIWKAYLKKNLKGKSETVGEISKDGYSLGVQVAKDIFEKYASRSLMETARLGVTKDKRLFLLHILHGANKIDSLKLSEVLKRNEKVSKYTRASNVFKIVKSKEDREYILKRIYNLSSAQIEDIAKHQASRENVYINRKSEKAVQENKKSMEIDPEREEDHRIEGSGKIIPLGTNKKMYEKRFRVAINGKKTIPFECPICRRELEIEVDFRSMGVSGVINLDTVCPLCSATLKGSLETTDD